MQKITTFLTFDRQAEEAVAFYTSVFPDSKVLSTMKAGDQVLGFELELAGQRFMFLNGGPTFTFSLGISLFISCETQEEIDRYWSQLGEGGKYLDCGWLTDRYGVAWQVIPTILGKMLADPDPARSQRVAAAMMTMQKLDIAAFKRAYEG